MQDDTLRLTYDIDPIMAKAMGFAGAKLQKTASPRLKRKQFLFFAVAVVALLVLSTGLFHGFNIEIWNAGFLVGIVWAFGAFFLMQRLAIEGLAENVTETAMKRGKIRLTVGPSGLSEQSGIGRLDVVWDVVNEIEGLPGATVIRFGGMCFAIPDTALPEDLSPDQFREKLISWRDATEIFG